MKWGAIGLNPRRCGGVGKLYSARCQMGADWVLFDVALVVSVVGGILDAVVCKASLPHIQLALESEGKAAFDELHGFLDGDIWGAA